MRYSLLSRFQGALLGNAVECLSGTRKTSNPLQPLENPSPWSDMQYCAAESLIECGKLDRTDWLERIGRRRKEVLTLQHTASSSEVALAALPIVLYFHEDIDLLQSHLLEAATLWQAPSESTPLLLAWGVTISLALREKLDSRFVLSQLQSVFAELTETLQHLESLIDRGIGLVQIPRQLNAPVTPLLLALYCFAATPEDFSLCVARALQIDDRASTTAALTGALAGGYNSLNGIPLSWRDRNFPNTESLKRQATQLFAAWSGAYRPRRKIPDDRAIAAAGTIQPRSRLRIISQKPS
ncbi:ADP-ribosylglycohydrolase family protein [Lusitaniella coriacea]|uniref:ADP-ribosylglycohydrolase family protein n=1 Tax=Lusitaniella coriacea TaxID=1983105 RepID=UPI003CEC6432